MNIQADIKKYMCQYNITQQLLELTEDILVNWKINPEAYAADPEEYIAVAFDEAQMAMDDGCCYNEEHYVIEAMVEAQIDRFRAEY
jgi:argininosuccinate lyase